MKSQRGQNRSNAIVRHVGFVDVITRNKKVTMAIATAFYVPHLFESNPPTLCTRSSAIAEGPRDASCQLKSCQLPRNSAETTYTTSPDQIDGMKLEI